MDDSKIYEITIHRLQRWSLKLRADHATPLCLVGVGHDHKLGQLVVCVPEEFTNFDIIEILKAVQIQLIKEDPYR